MDGVRHRDAADASDGLSVTEKSIIVVGAGLVGAVQALLFAKAGYSVTVVEKNTLRHETESGNQETQTISSRTVALSHRSWQLLSEAGLWPTIDCCAIQTVHVTEQGNFGSVKLDARKLDVEALGFVISNAGFESYLHRCLKSEANIHVIESASVVSVESDNQTARVVIEQAGICNTFSVSLVVAADGTHSTVRQMLGIETKQRDYEQCAVLANVRTSKSLANSAFERFTRDGPLALLPLASVSEPSRVTGQIAGQIAGQVADQILSDPDQSNQGQLYSMIYTAPSAQAARLTEMPDQDFLGMVQRKFGGKLGRFENISKRYVADLALTVSMQQVKGRFVLIGNAARTLHPVAGQGMNLALRDVFELVSCVIDHENIDAALAGFEKQRKRDQWWVTSQTDLLARLFGDKPWPLRLPASVLTGCGFVLLDIVEPFKKSFAAANMGRHVPLSSVLRDSVTR